MEAGNEQGDLRRSAVEIAVVTVLVPACRRILKPDDDTANCEGDNEMGKVTTGGTMSLGGYIAGPDESGFDLLFQWYGNGDVEIPSASPDKPDHGRAHPPAPRRPS